MTVVVIKDNVMAADSMAFTGSLRMPASRPKVHRRDDGALIGLAGNTGNCDAAREWFLAGEGDQHPPLKPDEDGALAMLILRPDGRAYRANDGFRLYEIPPIYAIGYETSATLAMGAMYAGATAREAVALAIKHTVWVGGEVFSISL